MGNYSSKNIYPRVLLQSPTEGFLGFGLAGGYINFDDSWSIEVRYQKLQYS